MAKVTANKSLVKVEDDDGRLRLRFTHAGKRYSMALGLYDGKLNRVVAQQKANLIEGDIVTGNFDSTLKKYRVKRGDSKPRQVTTDFLFAQFMQCQINEKSLHVGSISRYKATLNHLRAFFSGESYANSVTSKEVQGFVAYLKARCSIGTTKEYVVLIRSCWNWAKAKDLVIFTETGLNPWDESLRRLRKPPQQKVKPFTASEVAAIQAAFKGHRDYGYYADFVVFLFGTGCRFGEAVGLQWKHVSENCNSVWFGESASRGVRKSTKTNKARTVLLTPTITEMLLARRSLTVKPDDLVFPAARGGLIRDNTFRANAWKTILNECGITYRKPYSMRHTAISHALANGANPLAVAESTGHDPAVLFKHYASVIQRIPVMVEF